MIQTWACIGCGEDLPLEAYYTNGEGSVIRWCKPCRNNKYVIIRRQARLEAIEHYGGSCACCGEDREPFLVLDHVEGGGNKHRKSVGHNVALWAKRQGWPPMFRILCHNCNMAMGIYGVCPHASEIRRR